MTTLTLVFAVLAVLVALAGLRRRREVSAETRRRGGPDVDDEAMRRIQEEGRMGSAFEDEDEPLDLDEIDREERRFWEESSWDEPEEL